MLEFVNRHLEYVKLPYSSQSLYFCSEPEISELKENFNKKIIKNDSCDILASNGKLVLKDTKSVKGFTLTVTENVETGSIFKS